MVQVLLSTLSKSITKFFTLNFYMIDCLRPEFNQISGNLHQPTNTLLFFCLGGVTVEAVKLVSGCSCGRCHETTPVLISQPPYKFRTRKWRLYRNDIGISQFTVRICNISARDFYECDLVLHPMAMPGASCGFDSSNTVTVNNNVINFY